MSLNRIIESGLYVGNGASQSILIGWQPALVVTLSTRTSGPAAGRAVVFKTPDMSGDIALSCNAAAEMISSAIALTSTGFTVYSDDNVNKSPITFHWFAFRACPAVDSGLYTGTGTAQTITTARQPGAVFIFQTSGTARAIWKVASQSGAYTKQFETAVAGVDNQVTLTSTGFQVDGNANTDTETYAWVALYDIVGGTRHIESDTYLGDGGGSKTVTLNYQPKWVFLLPVLVAGSVALATDTQADSDYGELITGWNWEPSGVAIVSTGFTLTGVYNSNGTSYDWLAGVY